MRQCRRRHDCRILDTNAMMNLIALFQPTQDRNRVFHIGFAHEDDLEAPLEGCVFLDVLAVFVQGGGANRTQFSACQSRLEHVRGVNGAFRGAGADQSVQLVDKQNHLS